MRIVCHIWLLFTLIIPHSITFAVEQGGLVLPEGFQIHRFASDLPAVRGLAVSPRGTVFAGSLEGRVYALQDRDGDGSAEQRYVIAEGLNHPNGVAFRDGHLYVAEVQRLLRYDDIEAHLAKPPVPKVLYSAWPDALHHGFRYLRFGPDGKLYTGIGAPCNVCDPAPPFAALTRLDADGKNFEIIARGIRNTVGFDWHPTTGALFFTDNGRDHLGDDQPYEELNQWTKSGAHYGYPYCHGGTLADPEFGRSKDCKDFTAPVWRFPAHMAPLGVKFYRGERFPQDYRGQLFVALHGSWNRRQPQGYKVVALRFVEGLPVAERDFVSGWLTTSGQVLGRPVDIAELPDGSLLISDDHAGVIHRVDYAARAYAASSASKTPSLH